MRKSTNVVIFLVILNASATGVIESGLAADWGLALQPGAAAAIQNAIAAMKTLNPSSGIGSTLFSLYVAVSQTFNALLSVLFAAPTMFQNLGVPAWMTGIVFAPQYIVAGLDIIYALTGRDL